MYGGPEAGLYNHTYGTIRDFPDTVRYDTVD